MRASKGSGCIRLYLELSIRGGTCELRLSWVRNSESIAHGDFDGHLLTSVLHIGCNWVPLACIHDFLLRLRCSGHATSPSMTTHS